MSHSPQPVVESSDLGTEIIRFDGADLGYGRRAVLTSLSLTLRRGDFLGIVGPNGTGKTTILKAMLGMLRPIRGQVHIASGVRFGYVPQRQSIDEVYPVTALDVALMGRYRLMGAFARPSQSDRELVRQCLDNVGIAGLAHRPYSELSGGQKQRVLIARALSAEADALILDEPTNDMDIGSEHAIMELLKDLRESHGKTIVMVSHLLNVVINYADTLALIDGGLRMTGRTDELLTSENLSHIYEAPVEVVSAGDRKTVIVGGHNAQHSS